LSAIRLEGVSKSYRRVGRRSRFWSLKSAFVSRKTPGSLEADERFTALASIDLEVAQGESLGVIGGNGSGKSTLLKLVAGILKPTAGTVTVSGRVAALLELGAGFHPEISGRENVLINGVMLGLARKEIARRFDSIVRFAGMEEFIEEPVKNYSSGMYVRLGFAIAVHTDPEVLLVDEVLAVGDEEFSHRCLAKIREMQNRGTTILFVTHSLGLVIDLCDRAAWLDEGRIVAVGDPREVVDRYRLAVAEEEGRKGGAPLKETPAVEGSAESDSGSESRLDHDGEAGDSNAVAPQAQALAVLAENPRAPKRWGSGAARVRSLWMEGSEGNRSLSFHAGDAVTICLDVEPDHPLDDFVFGIALYDRTGIWVHGTNTVLEGLESRRFDGPAVVRIRIDSLDLVAGDYDLDAAIHARDGVPYDYRRSALSFHVTALSREVGLWNPKRSWSFEGGVAIQTRDGRKR